MVKVPMLKLGQEIDGLILSEVLIDNIMDRFFSSKETIPCFNDKGVKVGDVKNMNLAEDIVYFHIDFHKEIEDVEYSQAKPGIEYAARILKVQVSQ